MFSKNQLFLWRTQIQTIEIDKEERSYMYCYFTHLHTLIWIFRWFWCPKWIWQKFCHKKACPLSLVCFNSNFTSLWIKLIESKWSMIFFSSCLIYWSSGSLLWNFKRPCRAGSPKRLDLWSRILGNVWIIWEFQDHGIKF